MFDFDDEEQRWAAMHHPFTAPRAAGSSPCLARDPAKRRAQAYDLVINGSEAGGGTIRIHDSRVQQQVFDLLGIDAETAQERFGFLLDALQYGAPPHGGIALGIDRLVMLFGRPGQHPRLHRLSQDPAGHRPDDRRPGAVERKQLHELGIRVGTVHDQ